VHRLIGTFGKRYSALAIVRMNGATDAGGNLHLLNADLKGHFNVLRIFSATASAFCRVRPI
jgi:hypothetical protein